MASIFFSDENFKLVFSKIYSNVENKYGFSINSNENLKRKIFEIMKTIYTSKDKLNIPSNLDESDNIKYLLNKTVQYFMLYFEKMLNSSDKNNYLTQIDTVNNSVSNDNLEFNSFDETIYNNSKSLGFSSIDNPIETTYNKPDLKAISETPQFNTDNIPIHNSSKDLTLVNLLKENIAKIDDLNVNFKDEQISKFEKDVGDLFYALKDSGNLKIKTHNLIIDTGDCPDNCSNNKLTPFDIKVKFGTAIPARTDKRILRTISGGNGSIHTQEYHHSGYNETNPLCSNLYISEELKNVCSIKINRVVIPQICISGARYPFLYLCIDEYNSNVITTGNINNIFLLFHIDNNTNSYLCSNN